VCITADAADHTVLIRFCLSQFHMESPFRRGEQPLHPEHPQLHFPCFFSLILLRTMKKTISATTISSTIDARFCLSHSIINKTLLHL
jgi:hypothetical protein